MKPMLPIEGSKKVKETDWDGVSMPLEDLPQQDDKAPINMPVPKGFSKVDFNESHKAIALYRENSPRGIKIVVYTNFQRVYSRFCNKDTNTVTEWHRYPAYNNINADAFMELVRRGEAGLCFGHGELYWYDSGNGE